MTSTLRKTAANRFQAILTESARLNRKRIKGKQLDPTLVALASWQSERLQHTYADFAAQSRFSKALQFFLDDLYGPVDFSQRDEDIQRVYPVMIKVLSADAITSLGQGLELNSLTMKLDVKMVQVLTSTLGFNPGDASNVMDEALYAEAYRLCDNHADRQKQIALVVDVGKQLQEVTTKRLILAAVKLARKPAHIAGFGDLQSFIERGLAAFRAMGKHADDFIEAINHRETLVMEAICNAEPIPGFSAETPVSRD